MSDTTETLRARAADLLSDLNEWVAQNQRLMGQGSYIEPMLHAMVERYDHIQDIIRDLLAALTRVEARYAELAAVISVQGHTDHESLVKLARAHRQDSESVDAGDPSPV